MRPPALSKTLLTPATLTTGLPCSLTTTSRFNGLGPAAEHEQLGNPNHEEERHARREAMRRGAEALEDLALEPWADREEVERIRRELRDRMQHHARNAHDLTHRRLRTGVLRAERRMLVRLRNEGAISDETLRLLEEELDHEAVRVGAGDVR